MLRHVNLRDRRFDYQILYGLVAHLSYVQVGDARLFKRLHGESDGVAAADIWRPPVVLAPWRLLRSDLTVASHYLQAQGWV